MNERCELDILAIPGHLSRTISSFILNLLDAFRFCLKMLLYQSFIFLDSVEILGKWRGSDARSWAIRDENAAFLCWINDLRGCDDRGWHPVRPLRLDLFRWHWKILLERGSYSLRRAGTPTSGCVGRGVTWAVFISGASAASPRNLWRCMAPLSCHSPTLPTRANSWANQRRALAPADSWANKTSRYPLAPLQPLNSSAKRLRDYRRVFGVTRMPFLKCVKFK